MSAKTSRQSAHRVALPFASRSTPAQASSNGINTVYQVGTAGSLPTLANASVIPITILPGFPTGLANAAGVSNPFGIWFADTNTVYIADEGDGTLANAATSKVAGLQKWSLVKGVWQLDYVLQNGLGLGVSYGVPGYPTSLNPETDGLRNITGKVNSDGTVTIYGITSTVSLNGDQGADPNKLLAITDVLSNLTASGAASEQFITLDTLDTAKFCAASPSRRLPRRRSLRRWLY